MELVADGLSDAEISIRFRRSLRTISMIRNRAATKLAARNASAHPFQIREVVFARSLDLEVL